jgi:hypothetical protein
MRAVVNSTLARTAKLAQSFKALVPEAKRIGYDGSRDYQEYR